MNFDLTEEQRLLAESVRRFVARDYTFEARRRIVESASGTSDATWSALAELGVLGLSVPVDRGGFGGGATDLMSVMETFGEALLVEPYLDTVVGARFVARGGSADVQQAVLPALAEGRVKMALACHEACYDLSRVAVTARREGDAYRLDGLKRIVTHAPCARYFIVTARTSGGVADFGGVSVFLVDAAQPGVSLNASRTLDEMRAADVTLRNARGVLLASEGDGLALAEDAFDFASALLCAEAVGAMRFANETTLEYLKTRKQFGVPIGSFQALQHRMVDMVISLEQARSMASLACARVDADPDPIERMWAVSAAKARIARACRHVSQESIQLHGGMGMSEELKVSHTFRRLTVIAQQFGDLDHHLERFARLSGVIESRAA